MQHNIRSPVSYLYIGLANGQVKVRGMRLGSKRALLWFRRHERAGDAGPFFDEAIKHRQERGAEKDTDEAEGDRATDDAKENQHERHRAALADEPWLHNIVDAADDQPPDQHKDCTPGETLAEEPDHGRDPHQ